MGTVVIEGYLTESKLAAALRDIVGEAWRGGEVSFPGSRRRCDMALSLEGKTVFVEYDGDEHYRNSLKIKADQEKDAIARSHGVKLVRVPYWVQLDSVTLRHYLNLDAAIRQTFPHGFITTKLFPASYCEFGVLRFSRELSELPGAVRAAVIRSLRDRAEEFGVEFVLPSSLRHLASDEPVVRPDEEVQC